MTKTELTIEFTNDDNCDVCRISIDQNENSGVLITIEPESSVADRDVPYRLDDAQVEVLRNALSDYLNRDEKL